MTTPLLACALLCPPDGEVYNALLLMRVYKAPLVRVDAVPIAPGTVLRIETDLIYSERDHLFRKGIAFSGGTLTIRVNGDTGASGLGNSNGGRKQNVQVEVVIEILFIVACILLGIFVVPLALIVGIGILWLIVMGPVVALLAGIEALCKRVKAAMLARSD